MFDFVDLILVLVILFILFLFFQIGIGKFDTSKLNLTGKYYVLTGGSSGIGYEGVKKLLRQGAHVVIASPSEMEGQTAYKSLLRELIEERRRALSKTRIGSPTGNLKSDLAKYEKDLSERAMPMVLELKSHKSVRKFASNVLARLPRLDALIHNAGILTMFLAEREETEDGLEAHMAINCVSPWLLSGLLLPLLARSSTPSSPARIVVVSSFEHRFAELDLDNINIVVSPGLTIKKENSLQDKSNDLKSLPDSDADSIRMPGSKKFGWKFDTNFLAYKNSKLMTIMMVRELARRLHLAGMSPTSYKAGLTLKSSTNGYSSHANGNSKPNLNAQTEGSSISNGFKHSNGDAGEHSTTPKLSESPGGLSSYAIWKVAKLNSKKSSTEKQERSEGVNRKCEEQKAWITVNTAHPGCCNTGITRDAPPFIKFCLPITRPMFKSADQCSQAILYPALSDTTRNVTSCYFVDCTPSRVAPVVLDDQAVSRIWDFCEKATGFRYPIPSP